MKTSIFITAISVFLFSMGCSTTTYLSLTENNQEQIEQKLNGYEQDADERVEVTLTLENSKVINGELLSIRESSVTICTEYSAEEWELAILKYPINIVQNDEIQKITIEGSNYVWIATGVGMLVGFGVAYAMDQGAKPGQIVEPFVYPLGFLVGVIAGFVGYALSTEEYILQEIPPGYDFSYLKPLARYPDEEPEYLRAIE